MDFIDEIFISVHSGKGGPGKVSFRREKYVPRGGPDGGNGGKGGNVVFKIDPEMNSLLNYRFKRSYKAGDGKPGEGSLCSGATGEALILEVPRGTIVRNAKREIILDLETIESPYTFLEGGRGGKGNAFFKTSTNQAPRHAQPGEPALHDEIWLELKLLADVGIIGYPNAGKSSLISKISAAHPKIADYPFTTLSPALGVVRFGELKSYVVADIPGLIPGAHKGAGLGNKFLKHIERTRFFIHLIDGSVMSGRDPVKDFKDINSELKNYDKLHKKDLKKPLGKRPQLVVINKADIIEPKELLALKKKFKKLDIDPMVISAATGKGTKDLIFEVGKRLFKNEK